MKPFLPRVLGAALCAAALLLAWGWMASQRLGLPHPELAIKERHRFTPGLLAAADRSGRPGETARAWERLLANEPFVLNDNGQTRQFRLSLHEIYLPTAKAGERLQVIEPQSTAEGLIAAATKAAPAGQTAGWVLYPAESGKDDPALRRVLHSQILVQVRDRDRAREAVTANGLRLMDEPDYAPNHWILEASGGPSAVLQALAVLSMDAAFDSAMPLLLHAHSPKLVPDDPLFTQQWHLQNTGQGGGKLGSDINVTDVWNTRKGSGVRVGIVDSGLDMLHPDLMPNLDTEHHYDWNDVPPDTDPTAKAANQDFHGTAVAGVAGARGGNALGVSGVAPQATLVGYRLIAEFTNDTQDGDAMIRGSDVVHIKNCSWGHADGYPWLLYTPGPLITAARKAAATTGRGGLGTVFVWASGNGRDWGDQGNKDCFANSMYAVNVGAVDNRGVLAGYTETGAHLTVVAPGSGGSRKIVTTDLRSAVGYNTGFTSGNLADLNYTNGFGGTSAAAPIVSGVVALMLEANPDLSWRDVKEILLRSSVKLAPSDFGWVTRNGGLNPALPPIKHHHSYGGGLVDAEAAVTMAAAWTPLPQPIEVSRVKNWPEPYQPIPDNNHTGLTTSFDFNDAGFLRVENVTVTVNIQHPYRGDLQVALRSPGGVESLLATKESRDSGENYYDFTFSSMRHWGEAAAGEWKLIVKDLAPSDKGAISSARVTLHGTPAPPVEITASSNEPRLLEEGSTLILTGQTTGFGHVTHEWRRNGAVVSNEATYNVLSTTLANAGSYRLRAANLSGTAEGPEVAVSVVRRTMTPATVKEGGTIVLKAITAGPNLKYQWFRGEELLSAADERVTGFDSATLTIKGAGEVDQATYFCRVSMPDTDLKLDTLPVSVTVLMKPVLAPPLVVPGLVSSSVSYAFTAEHGATRFAASGVPAGMTFNTATGTLSGRPNAPGTFRVKVTATNAAGTSAPLTVSWTVEALPEGFRGTFTGVVERHDTWNNGLGGSLRITVAPSGSFTGTLVLAGRSRSLSGRLEVDADGGGATAQPKVQKVGSEPPPQVILTFDPAAGTVAGSVGVSGDAAAMLARRCPWSYAVKAAAYAGRFNGFLEPTPPPLPEDTGPYGNGYAITTVSATGGVTWAGRLADGSAITGGTTVAENGQIPLHLSLYGATGSVQGWTTITAGANAWDGLLDWLKNEQPVASRTRQYKDGFPMHSLTLVGARYTKPPAGTPVLDLPLPAGPGANAQISFNDGGLAGVLSQPLTINGSNGVKVLASETSPKSIRLSLNSTTGMLSGSFVVENPDPTDTSEPISMISRSATFAGVLVTRPDVTAGRGYFLLPMLPNPPKTTATTSPILSGRLVLGPP